jgi:hypothetical protein
MVSSVVLNGFNALVVLQADRKYGQMLIVKAVNSGFFS